MNIVFMGSPDFAVPSLQALIKHYAVCAVVTQPDRRAGRGQSMRESAVKKLAVAHHLSIIQPQSLRDEEVYNELDVLHPDLIIVAAFGQILPQTILDLPRFGCINVHASLLPRWRGAAPVQAAILEGDSQTGVSIMEMDAGLDTGPILKQRSIAIHDDETGGDLENRLAELGSKVLLEVIPGLMSGDIKPMPQHEPQATYAPMIKKKDGHIDPTLTAERLARQVRAFEPWPTSFFFWDDLRIVVREARPHPHSTGSVGTIELLEGIPAINTADGSLLLDKIQPAGKREMSSKDFINGAPDFIGSTISGLKG
jgi:methionyl-tRNA formyltransferase